MFVLVVYWEVMRFGLLVLTIRYISTNIMYLHFIEQPHTRVQFIPASVKLTQAYLQKFCGILVNSTGTISIPISQNYILSKIKFRSNLAVLLTKPAKK